MLQYATSNLILWQKMGKSMKKAPDLTCQNRAIFVESRA